MGLMKKVVRRATPRPVRKATRVVKHPVGTAIGAATPRSIRKVKRTAFNVAHPVNTAENTLLNAATPKRGRRSKRKGDELSGAANAAIFAFIFVALIAGLIGGDRGAKVGGIVAFSVAVVVYLLLKIGGAAGRTPAPSATTAPESHAGDVAFPKRVTTAWLQREVPTMSEASYERLVDLLVSRGWDENEIEQRVRARRAPGLWTPYR
jgi:hypothetical protein